MAAALEITAADTCLEPCVGSGALLRALARKGVPPSGIRGVDLDRRPSPSDRHARVLRGVDFLSWSQSTSERFSKIIANPPYLALNRLPVSLRRRALEVRDPFSDRTVRLRGNCWHAFLCASLGLLKPRGSLCFLLPASWDFSDYAAALRKGLGSKFEDLEVHRSRAPLFDCVQDGSVVLVARGYLSAPRRQVRFEHATAADLICAAAGKRDRVEPRQPQRAGHCMATPTASLGDLVDIRIGAVTGDARYFLLTDSERREHHIPTSACKRMLTHAGHLVGSAITRERWDTLRQSDERVWLFRPSATSARGGPVKRYLALPLKEGGCDRARFKVRTRRPWYRTPLPMAANAFVSGMSRSGPWLSLSAMPGLSASNTLYVIRFRYADSADARAAIALGLLTTGARVALALAGRRYADGLLKFEPRDLRGIPIPTTTHVAGANDVYDKAVQALLHGDSARATCIADEWFVGAIQKPEVLRATG